MKLQTKYARSGDLSIAYQLSGDGPIDLVFVPGFVSHLELQMEEPRSARFFNRLASFSRLIRFDKRGTGLSDRTVPIPTLEQRMDDVRAVMDAVGSQRAVLFGISEGCPMSMLFAATYPERTTALVLYGSFARAGWAPDYAFGRRDDERDERTAALVERWGTGVLSVNGVSTQWIATQPRRRERRRRGSEMSDLLYEIKDKIATITLNRPDKLNAFTGDMIEAWAKSLAEAQADDEVNVVIVTGAGRAFCSGGDVGRMRERGTPSPLDGKNTLWEGVHRVPKALETMDKPVIAMVNGLAVGAGMGMSVMCDVRIAAESARFSTGYVRVGLVPGDGDTYFLPRLVGAAKALELLWTADFIEAPEAHRLGIVQRVVPDAQLKEATYAFARQIADGPQIPIRMIKRLVYQSLKLDLRTHLDLVSSHMSIVRQTADHAEGVAAFKDKRPPKFQGR